MPLPDVPENAKPPIVHQAVKSPLQPFESNSVLSTKQAARGRAAHLKVARFFAESHSIHRHLVHRYLKSHEFYSVAASSFVPPSGSPKRKSHDRVMNPNRQLCAL